MFSFLFSKIKISCYFWFIFFLFIVITFSSSSAQTRDIEKYLDTPAGQNLIEKYGKDADKKDELKKQFEDKDLIDNQDVIDKDKEILPKEKTVSEFEESIFKNLPLGENPIYQFGYDIFQNKAGEFIPSEDVPVGPDYIIGPGDSFNLTLWGIAEGIFKVDVDRAGNIVLPKVGVVKVAGLRFGQLEPFLVNQLGRYYEKVNIAVTIANLRTIRVYLVGEVNAPGSYMISSLSTVYTALFAAGGPTKKGTLRNIQLIRNGRKIANLDFYNFLLKGDRRGDHDLQSGDTIFVPLIGNLASIWGSVYRPAIYEIKGATDLGDLISLSGGFLPSSYLNRVQVERFVAHQKKIIRDENVSSGRSLAKFGLKIANMDLVKVFPIFENISNLVYLEGEVKYPGEYEYKKGMSIKEIILSKSAFKGSAYLPRVEIIRTDPKTREAIILSVDFEKLFSGDAAQNIKLKPLDRIFVTSDFREEQKVVLKGEFKRPGVYTIVKGEKLSSILNRAGGFTEEAYLYGAVFARKTVKEIQEKRTKELVEKLKQDTLRKIREISAGALTESDRAIKEAELKKSEELIKMVENKTLEGRVIVRLSDPEKLAGSIDDLELESSDTLFVPKISRVVNVLGEVYNPNAILYEKEFMLKDYLAKVGGPTKNADNGALFIIRADGSVISKEQSVRIDQIKLMPGDTVLVPQKIEELSFWAILRSWTHWLYEMAVATAAISVIFK
jgi:protein involved in polysaccharide export with SLBB domain